MYTSENKQSEIVLHRYYFESSKLGDFVPALKKVPQDFVQSLAKAFEYPEEFKVEDFKHTSIPVLLDYLKHTHKYYQGYYFSKIEQSIEQLYSAYPEAVDLLDLLNAFFKEYRADIFEHIAKEEDELFPYIYEMLYVPSTLLKAKRRIKYSITDFQKSHDDENENALIQIVELIKQRYPAAVFSPLNILLKQIEAFEKDLRIHSKIEEELLLPKAKRLERLVNNRN